MAKWAKNKPISQWANSLIGMSKKKYDSREDPESSDNIFIQVVLKKSLKRYGAEYSFML